MLFKIKLYKILKFNKNNNNNKIFNRLKQKKIKRNICNLTNKIKINKFYNRNNKKLQKMNNSSLYYNNMKVFKISKVMKIFCKDINN